jgi:hypothetical protein
MDGNMKSFSQRKGLKPVKSVMQVESMDEDLRNGLWNNLCLFYWDILNSREYGHLISQYGRMDILFKRLWHLHFKWPLDTLDDYWPNTREQIKDIFFKFTWDEVYSFIEFVANNHPNDDLNLEFMDACNEVLERELSAYRFVGDSIMQITSEEEIEEIEKGLEVPLKPVNTHLKTALDLLANRKSPDYRNSIKESISAVEAICKIITGKDKATLSYALKQIDKKVELHPALKKAFECLYGYTSDAEGIRHALMDKENLYFEDAKFMLVSCSAFINYLVAKSSKAGIKL